MSVQNKMVLVFRTLSGIRLKCFSLCVIEFPTDNATLNKIHGLLYWIIPYLENVDNGIHFEQSNVRGHPHNDSNVTFVIHDVRLGGLFSTSSEQK